VVVAPPVLPPAEADEPAELPIDGALLPPLECDVLTDPLREPPPCCEDEEGDEECEEDDEYDPDVAPRPKPVTPPDCCG